LLSQQPENQRALNLAGRSFKQLENYQQAVHAYKKLYQLTGSIYNLYETAFLQFQAGQYQACLKSAEQLLNNPQSEKNEVTIQISKSTEQTVPIKAAILNLKGAVYEKLEQPDKAREHYNKALEVTSDFMLPQQNLEEMDE
jgi:tetratricopeptide (TPR) repeat protein